MSERRRLIIDLDIGADPVRGSIGPSNGAAEPFSGYVQLIAALEEFRALDGYGEEYRGRGDEYGGHGIGHRGERDHHRVDEAALGRGAVGRGAGAREAVQPPGSVAP
jgi:hypothetical protein